MANIETNPQLKLIQSRLETMKHSTPRKQWLDNAKRMRDLYKGEIWPDDKTGSETLDSDHKVTINLPQSSADIIVSSIAYTDPEFQIVPMEPAAKQNAPYQKAALSKVWSEIGAAHVERKRLKDAVVYGIGVVFVGWLFEENNQPPKEGTRPAAALATPKRASYQPPDESALSPEADELVEAGIEPEMAAAVASIPESPAIPWQEPLLEEESEIDVLYDNPLLRRVSPLRFYVDPDHDDIEDLRQAAFVVEEKYVRKVDLENDERYSNTDNLKADLRESFDENDKVVPYGGARPPQEEFVKVYDYWQKDGRKHYVIADGQWDRPLLEEDWPYPYNSYPYTTLVYRSIPDQQEPQGAIEPAETSAKLYNLYRSIQIRHDEQIARTPLGFDENMVTADGLKRLRGTETMPLVPCNGPPESAIQPIHLTPLSREFYVTQDAVKQDVDIAMATNDYQRGLPDTTRRTFGEVSMINSLSASRGQLLQRLYEIACAQDANLVLSLLQDPTFCDRERWMAITGEKPQEIEELNWNADTIKGQSDVRVICNSTRVQTPESVQQNMVLAIQSLAQPAQAGVINLAPFLRKFAESLNMSPTEMEEIMNADQDQNGQALQQLAEAVEQQGQMLQQLGQYLQQLAEQVQQIQAELESGAVDAKTQMELRAREAELQHRQQAHELDINHLAQKHAIELDALRSKATVTTNAANPTNETNEPPQFGF